VSTLWGPATVPTTPVPLVSTDYSGQLLVQGDATNPVYLGTAANVTAANGIKVAANALVTVPIGQGPGTVYAIATGAPATIVYWFGDNPS
jgi:voltage-gated potassium channel Kch